MERPHPGGGIDGSLDSRVIENESVRLTEGLGQHQCRIHQLLYCSVVVKLELSLKLSVRLVYVLILSYG